MDVMDVELGIGDISNAIRLIQDTQTDALKALAELIENAIDASATKCDITRKKIKGHHALIIRDYGNGFPPNINGVPDFKRAITNICNSLKRRMNEEDRQSVQGEFGIGMLGFSAIGESMEVVSKCDGSISATMKLTKGAVKAHIEEHSLKEFQKGTEVTIWPIHKAVAHKLTPERISKYLGEELAERIKNSGILISVSDPHKKVTKQVKPLSYEGPKLHSFDKIMSKSGCNMHFDLHECARDKIGAIAIVRKGTKILDDITEIEEFNCDPWNKRLVEGKIDYKLLNVPPATRKGIIRDSAYDDFFETCKKVEADLKREVESIEKKRAEKIDPKFVKKIQETFEKVMEELGNNYAWFGAIPKGGLPKEPPSGPTKPRPVSISFGKLHEVRIRPAFLVIAPNETKKLGARAYDDKGGVLISGVSYSWRLQDSIVSIKANNDELTIIASDEHVNEETEVAVIARQGELTAEAVAKIAVISEKKPKHGGGLNIQFDTTLPLTMRSLFNEATRQIRINSKHQDYIDIEGKGTSSIFRYVCFLVANHLAFYNHKGEGEEKVLDSFVEIMAAYEKVTR